VTLLPKSVANLILAKLPKHSSLMCWILLVVLSIWGH